MNPFKQMTGGVVVQPMHLLDAAREARYTFRKLKLLGAMERLDDEELLGRYALQIWNALKRENLDFKTARRLGSIVPWLHDEPQRWDGLLEALLQHLHRFTPRLPALSAAVLLEYFPSLRPLFHVKPPRSKNRRPLILSVTDPVAPELARRVLLDGVSLSDAIGHLRLQVGSPVTNAVIHLLTDVSVSTWLWSHSRDTLRPFLDTHSNGSNTGRVVNALLEPLASHVREPARVRQGTELGKIISFLQDFMPAEQRGTAWSQVHPDVKRLFRWWRVQRDLKNAFMSWSAEPGRKNFWWAQVGIIDEVEQFQRIDTIAIRIAGYWFVEVGHTGFATYVYSDSNWQKGLWRVCLNAWSANEIRQSGWHKITRLLHHHGWQSKFNNQIYRLTGRLPGETQQEEHW